MVNTARAETAQSEKLLKEANGKIDVLLAEVKALKELVLTSTPSTPNKHLHPQLGTNSHRSSHSRQSSLNQQTFNNIVNNSNNGSVSNLQPQNTSSPSASSINLSVPQNGLTNNKQDRLMVHSMTSLQPLANSAKEKSSFFTKSHKRAPSQNDIQTQPKSLLDKLFQSSNQQKKEKYDKSQNDSNLINESVNENTENNSRASIQLNEIAEVILSHR